MSEKIRICVFKKFIEKRRLKDAFHLENNKIVAFKICYRPDFQDEDVLIFDGMFLRVLLLFQAIPKLDNMFII